MDPTVVLKIGAEGGGYTILVKRHERGWCFKVHVVDQTSELANGPSVHDQSQWLNSLDEAFARINPAWPRLYPLAVAPEFAAELLARVRRYEFRNEHQRQRALSLWEECITSQ